MTISSETRKAGPFIGAGTLAVFPFTFKVFTASDLVVTELDTTSTVETTLVINSDYTVTLNANQNSNPGGTITLTAGNLAIGKNLVITSDVAYLQPTDLTNQGGFFPQVITTALDRLTVLVQQVKGIVSRGIRQPITDATAMADLPSAAERANKVLTFDADGNPIAIVPSSGSIAEFAVKLANRTNPAEGAGLVGIDTSLPYPSGTVGEVISTNEDALQAVEGSEAYLPPSGSDQTAAVNSLMLQGKNVIFGKGSYIIAGQVVMQPGCSWIGRGSKQTIVTTSYAGYCVLMRQGSVAIKGMTIKSTATDSALATASGVDLFTDAVHGWVIEDVIFKSLVHAWKAAGSYTGIFRDVTVEDCGTATEYAAWLGKNGGGIETNNIQYQNVHFVWDTWLGKGLYTEDYDHSFHGLHIEHCNVADGWTSNARGVTVNGSYLETHGGDSVNQITINNGAVFNGGLVNCIVNTDASAYKVVFNSTAMIYSKVPSFNCQINGPDIAGNRIARLMGNVFKYPVTIGTPTTVKLKTKTQGSFEEYDIGTGLKVSGVADTWVADYYGEAHTLSITSTAGEFLTGTRGLKFLKTGSTANGGAFGMCIPAHYQTQNRKLSAWAIVKVPQANTTIQCTFGFCGLDLSNGARGVSTSYQLGDGWVLLIVHDFVPTADYVAFVCNKIGGGNPTDGEYFFVDSFGVCEGGINYESITQV